EKLWRSADPQHSPSAAGEHGASRRQCLCFRHDTTTARDEVTAVGRQLESPTDTNEEPDTELLLKITYLPPQRGLAHLQPTAGARHAARVDDADEVAKVPQFHRRTIPLRHRS